LEESIVEIVMTFAAEIENREASAAVEVSVLIKEYEMATQTEG
jgi:hypothetical protein